MADFKPVKLAYRVQGTGLPLMLIHAFPLSKEMWEGQAVALAQHYRVITLDLPGFGASPRSPMSSIAAYVQSAAQLLEDLKVQEPVFAGGLSMGGYAVFEFFRQFPDKVRALGLFSTRAGADSEAQKKKRFELAGKTRQGGMPVLADAVKLLGESTQKNSPETAAAVRQMILKGSPEGAADAMLAMAARADSTDLLERISVPSLIIAGNEDQVIPLSEAELMEQKIAGSEMHVIEKAGHLINIEQPARFNELLSSFLKKI